MLPEPLSPQDIETLRLAVRATSYAAVRRSLRVLSPVIFDDVLSGLPVAEIYRPTLEAKARAIREAVEAALEERA